MADSGVRNCSRLCEHELRFSCDLEIPESNCVSTCTDALASDPCGVETTAALLCLLDQGVCPDQAAAPGVCDSAIERYRRCANPDGDEAEPDETLD